MCDTESKWSFLDRAMEGFGEKTPDQLEAERQRKLVPIRSEPKLEKSIIRDRASDFADDIELIADANRQYREEHFDVQKRYRRNGKTPTPNVFTFTVGDYRYRLSSQTNLTTSIVTRTVVLSSRVIDSTLPDDTHRVDETSSSANIQGFWSKKIILQVDPRSLSDSVVSIKYDGPDPRGDTSLGTFEISNTQRTSEGIEGMIAEFRQHCRPTDDLNRLWKD